MLRCAKSLVPALLVGTLIGWTLPQKAVAAPPETAPEALLSTIAEIEAAANAQDIEQVMALYSDGFEGCLIVIAGRTIWSLKPIAV
ncbi:MAG: hypothetical protein AAFW75_29660 [Cyanobacteria bacterium J06636_16]